MKKLDPFLSVLSAGIVLVVGLVGAPKAYAQASPSAGDEIQITPYLPQEGRYYMYLAFAPSVLPVPLKCTVKHRGGVESVEVASGSSLLEDAGRQWMLVGTFDFDAGANSSVSVRPADGAEAAFVTGLQVRWRTAPLGQAPAATEAPEPQAATGVSSGEAAPVVHWFTTIEEGRAESVRTGKRILLFFHASSNERSLLLEKTFDDPQVRKVLAEHYVAVRLNFVEHRDMAFKLNVFRAGTINIYDPEGNPLSQITERLDPREMVERLSR